LAEKDGSNQSLNAKVGISKADAQMQAIPGVPIIELDNSFNKSVRGAAYDLFI